MLLCTIKIWKAKKTCQTMLVQVSIPLELHVNSICAPKLQNPELSNLALILQASFH